MRIIKFLLILAMSWMTSAATFEDYRSVDVDVDMEHAFKTFGEKLIRRRSAIQEKRDISLSYAATNIKNKEGTQVKTITVIKNSNENNPKLKIKPELHKNNNWAQSFKDDFDSYGVIPDVPDIDDLFEYVNKKHSNDKNEKKENKTEEKNLKELPVQSKQNSSPKENEKPVTEISAEISEENKKDIKSVEKIKDDAELLPSFNSSRLKVRESHINLNYSTPQHSVHQYFDNYVQLTQSGKEFGYEYPKPCVQSQPVDSVTVATPTGRTYNIPSNNNSYINPYLAPTIKRRAQIQQQSPQTLPANNPTFPVNSLLPPLQQRNNNNNNNPTLNSVLKQQQISAVDTQQQQPPNTSLQPLNFQTKLQQQTQQPQNSQGQNNDISASQRPYVAPNIRSDYSSSSNINGFQNGLPVYRVNTFNNGFKKPNFFRSRGLKY